MNSSIFGKILWSLAMLVLPYAWTKSMQIRRHGDHHKTIEHCKSLLK